jgi:hypothetical protein
MQLLAYGGFVMKKIALLAAVVGATALAAPRAHADDRDEWRHERAGFHDAQRRGWVTLTAMDVHRKQTVDIDERLGFFRRLRLQAIRGAGYIDFIEIRFANGEQQHVDVQRRIGRGETADIDLNGERRVVALTVHGEPDGRAQIQIIGER